MAKPFNIVLSAEHRDMLETIRRHEGLRSEADVVRLLIEQRARSGLPSVETQATMKETIKQAQFVDGHGKPAKTPAPRPFTSRLKGEWKAP